jgi:hypothetical protein
MGVKIADPVLWDEIKSGKYNGFSVEMRVRKISAVVEMQLQNQVFGVTEVADDHTHVYYAEVNDDGKVIKGSTSYDHGHKHSIRFGTATESANEHKHRYFLP